MASRNTLCRILPDDRGCRVYLRASEWLGLAVVEWAGGSGIRRQTIVLNPGDYDLLVDGADPVADGWEDGQGHPVSYDHAEVQA